MRTKALYGGLSLLVMLAATGCLFSPDEPENPPPPVVVEYPFPGTKEQLLTNFKQAYEDMEINEYGKILHNDYKFILQEEDIIGGQLPYDHLNRDDDITIMTRIFSGNPYLPPDRDPEAAVTEITFSVLDPVTVWEASTHPDFPGAERAVFNVDLEFKRPVSTTILVSGSTEFYVVSRDSTVNGIPKQYWQIVGQVDATDAGGKSVAVNSP